MSEEPEDEAVEPTETEWQRRRRLAAVFGEDEADESMPDRAEEWLKRQVPPHHG